MLQVLLQQIVNSIKVRDCYILHTVLSYVYYFDDITKLKDFDIDNILIDERSHKNILIFEI